jgi:hypothetical protein
MQRMELDEYTLIGEHFQVHVEPDQSRGSKKESTLRDIRVTIHGNTIEFSTYVIPELSALLQKVQRIIDLKDVVQVEM